MLLSALYKKVLFFKVRFCAYVESNLQILHIGITYFRKKKTMDWYVLNFTRYIGGKFASNFSFFKSL